MYVNDIIVVRVYNTSHAKFDPLIKDLSAGYDKSSPMVWEIQLLISLQNEMVSFSKTRLRIVLVRVFFHVVRRAIER